MIRKHLPRQMLLLHESIDDHIDAENEKAEAEYLGEGMAVQGLVDPDANL